MKALARGQRLVRRSRRVGGQFLFCLAAASPDVLSASPDLDRSVPTATAEANLGMDFPELFWTDHGGMIGECKRLVKPHLQAGGTDSAFPAPGTPAQGSARPE